MTKPTARPSAPSPREEAAPADRRVRRTRRLLTEALLELVRERPFEAITARDVTDRAGVGYATFFRHYASTEDLMRQVVDDLLGDLRTLLPPLTGSDPQRAGAVIFGHAREHADLYRLLLRSDRSLNLVSDVLRGGVESLGAAYEAKPRSRVPFEVAANHVIGSFVNLLGWWLEHDMPYDPEHMGDIYRDLILRPTERAALQPRGA